MEISLNTEWLIEKEVTPDEFVILSLIGRREHETLLRMFPTITSILVSLQRRHFLKIVGDSPLDVVLRKQGISLLQEVDVPVIKDDDPSIWIDSWLDIFPEGVKTGSYYVRSNREDCIVKMRKFIKVYKYEKISIMTATQRYVDRLRMRGFSYMMAASNFIHHRDKGSVLASECANLHLEDGPRMADFGNTVHT